MRSLSRISGTPRTPLLQLTHFNHQLATGHDGPPDILNVTVALQDNRQGPPDLQVGLAEF